MSLLLLGVNEVQSNRARGILLTTMLMPMCMCVCVHACMSSRQTTIAAD